MAHLGGGVVVNPVPEVKQSPGQIGLLVRVEELTGQATSFQIGRPPDREPAADERRHRRRPARVTGPQSRHVPPGTGTAGRIHDPEREHGELRISREPIGDVLAEPRVGIPAVIVEEHDHVASAGIDAGVAPGGDPDVLRQPDRPHVVRHRRQIGAVADEHQIETLSPQGLGALDRPLKLRWPGPHRDNDAGQLHCSRLDATIAARCATTISAPTARQVTSRTRVASRPPLISSATAAIRISSESSTAWMIRCTRRTLAARLARARPEPRGFSASSACPPGSPALALATTTLSVSTLTSAASSAAASPAVTYRPDVVS